MKGLVINGSVNPKTYHLNSVKLEQQHTPRSTTDHLLLYEQYMESLIHHFKTEWNAATTPQNNSSDRQTHQLLE